MPGIDYSTRRTVYNLVPYTAPTNLWVNPYIRSGSGHVTVKIDDVSVGSWYLENKELVYPVKKGQILNYSTSGNLSDWSFYVCDVIWN